MGVKSIDGGQTPPLSKVAILVWHIQLNGDGREAWAAMLDREAEQSRRMEYFRAKIKQIVGERDDISVRINGGCIEAEVEDLCFVALEQHLNKQKDVLVTLLGRCPSCGVETVSEPFYNLAGLGKMLEKFVPMYRHTCYAR